MAFATFEIGAQGFGLLFPAGGGGFDFVFVGRCVCHEQRFWRVLTACQGGLLKAVAARRFLWQEPGSKHGSRCRSSVVEHSLGKGEVESPILSGSTIFPAPLLVSEAMQSCRNHPHFAVEFSQLSYCWFR
jgi:hypothetical protein